MALSLLTLLRPSTPLVRRPSCLRCHTWVSIRQLWSGSRCTLVAEPRDVSDTLSTARTLGCCVPQGSILRHLLFEKFPWLFILFLRPRLIDWLFWSFLICTEALLCDVSWARRVKKGSWKKVESSPSPLMKWSTKNGEVYFSRFQILPACRYLFRALFSSRFVTKAHAQTLKLSLRRPAKTQWRQVRRLRIAAHHEVQKAGKL